MDGTPASNALCRDIARISGGVCFLAFSRGKDSLAAWLQLRRFFDRVIPYHLASVPNLSWADESLAYYERVFQTPILRLMSEISMGALAEHSLQPLEDEEAIDALEIWDYNHRHIVDLLRQREGSPLIWAAYGLNASDSIDRRVVVGDHKGRHDSNRTFNPCWDWSHAQIMDAIHEHGLSLPRDYLMGNRTIANVPKLKHLYRMAEHFPDDFAKVEAMFPFIRATMARNEFRKMHGAAMGPADDDESEGRPPGT